MKIPEFEAHLRSLRPASIDDQTAETFYQSGWKACEASFAARQKSSSSASSLRSLVVGLCSGLLAAFAWMWATNEAPESPTSQMASIPEPAVDSPNDHEIDSPLDAAGGPVDSPAVADWTIDDLFHPNAEITACSLNRLVLETWDDSLRQRAVVSDTDPPASPARREPTLTASPLNPSLLRELL